MLCEAKKWTRQTLSDAWESTNWRRFVWHFRGRWWAPELKLTKKVTADKEGARPPLPRIVVERAPEVEPRRFYVLSADIEAHGHTLEAAQDCAALASHGKATKPHNDECRERISTIVERTLTFGSRLCAREHKTKKQGKIQRALPASQLFSAMPPLEAVKVLVSIMMSVSFVER